MWYPPDVLCCPLGTSSWAALAMVEQLLVALVSCFPLRQMNTWVAPLQERRSCSSQVEWKLGPVSILGLSFQIVELSFVAVRCSSTKRVSVTS